MDNKHVELQELRIGSVICDRANGVITVHRLLENRIRYKDGAEIFVTFPKQCFGIPLTSIFAQGSRRLIFDFAKNCSCYWFNGTVTIEKYGEGMEDLSHINSLHELQNLSYALTGKELDLDALIDG